ncbi:MAG: SDR family oxidoreductase [Christensenellales bacterium]
MIQSLFSVAGKIVFVTGSGRGIGLAIAKGYIAAGAKVVLNNTRSDVLEELVAHLRSQGGDVYGYSFDVSNEQEVLRYIDKIEQEVGPIDVLFNNAGIQRRAPLDQMTLNEWQDVLNVNLTSAFLVGQAVAKKMIPRGTGKIINVLSLNAELARTNIANYAASKGGLKMLTKAMATEWGPHGITANGLGPGYISTDMTRVLEQDPAFDSWVKSEVPLARWGKPEDLVGTAIFLGSPASDYINGFTVYVDGGWQASL